MDTNEQNKQGNIFINTFNGGMNSDTSFASVPNTQYSCAINVRQINGKDYFDSNEAQVEEKQGIIAPITYKNKEIVFGEVPIGSTSNISGPEFLYILNTFTIDDRIIILYKSRYEMYGKQYYLISVATGPDKNDNYPGKLFLSRRFSICDFDDPEFYKNVKNVSASIHKETDSVINLYLCDGKHQLMQINISESAKEYINRLCEISVNHDRDHIGQGLAYIIDTKYIQNNNYMPNKPVIVGQTSGNLKTGQVQYACVLYKKHGIQSCLSLLTNKIQIISNNRTRKQGCAEDTDSGIGIKLEVSVDYNQSDLFDMCKIYRIHYIKPGQTPEVHTVCDTNMGSSVIHIDTGTTSLEKLSLEELQSNYQQRIIPGVFTYNSQYGIVGDITDDTTISDIKDTSFQTYSLYIGKKKAIENFPDADKFIKPEGYPKVTEYKNFNPNKYAIYTVFKNDGNVSKYNFSGITNDTCDTKWGIIDNYPGNTDKNTIYSYRWNRSSMGIYRKRESDQAAMQIFNYVGTAGTRTVWTKYKYNYNQGIPLAIYDSEEETFSEIEDQFLKSEFCSIETGTYFEDGVSSRVHRYVYERTNNKIRYGVFKVIGSDVNINKHNMGLFTFDYRVLSESENAATVNHVETYNITGKYIYTDYNGNEHVGYYGCNINKDGKIVLINSDKKQRHIGTDFRCRYKKVKNSFTDGGILCGKFNVTIGGKKMTVYFDTTEEYIIPPGYTVPCTCGGESVDIIKDNVYVNRDQFAEIIKAKYKNNIVHMYGTGINGDLPASEMENLNPFDEHGEIDPFNSGYTVGGFSDCVQWKFVVLNSKWRTSKNDTSVSDFSLDKSTYYLDRTREGKYSIVPFSTIADTPQVEVIMNKKGVKTTPAYEKGYEDIFISSLFRSLMPGETYRYGIVFYTKEGKRSNVHWIADIKAPDILEDIYTTSDFDGKLPIIGLEFSVTMTDQLEKNNVSKYVIVRCKKRDIYTRILEQVTVSNVMRQDQQIPDTGGVPNKNKRQYSPYYSLGLIAINNIVIGLGSGIAPWPNGCYPGTGAVKPDTPKLYQIYSPGINYLKDSIYTKISASTCNMSVKYHIYTECNLVNEKNWLDDHWKNAPYPNFDNSLKDQDKNELYNGTGVVDFNVINRSKIKCRGSEKQKQYYYNYNIYKLENAKYDTVEIQKINQTKELAWNDAFTEVKREGDKVLDAIKKYTNFIQAVGANSFVNFATFGKYDGDPGANSTALFQFNFAWNGNPTTYNWENFREYTWKGGHNVHYEANGPLCAGGRSFVVLAKTPLTAQMLTDKLGSYVCNITHDAQQFSGWTKDEMKYDIYYDFGNSANINEKNYVFDGLHYLQKYQIISAHKIFDFTDYESNLQSIQVRNKIPMYSLVNEKLTYGEINNDKFTNLEIKPYSLDSLSAQEYQAYEYASIYSDNDFSVSVFNAESHEESIINFPHRIFYSKPKTDGENLDNWHVYKAADFIDGDAKCGRITDLFTYDNKTYVFQENGVGALSINEKQAMQNTSGENIILGTADIIKNINYISSTYGMRRFDLCKVGTNDAIYWFDYRNNCICQIKTRINSLDVSNCVNYSSQVNVSNIINNYNDVQIEDTQNKVHTLLPRMVFDNMRNELYFGNLKINDEYYSIIFNTKYSFAQTLISEYNDADTNKHKFLGFYNILGNVCKFELNNNPITIQTRGGIIQTYSMCDDKSDIQYLKPMSIQFVINNDTNSVKTFDNQQVQYSNRYGTDILENNQFFKDKKLKVFTDMYKGESYVSDTGTFVTDREGSVCYPIPRAGDDKNTSTDVYINGYGRRMRGRWMVETYTDLEPSKKSSIYNIITKTRKSYN